MNNSSDREEAIFEQAVNYTSDRERAAFLDQACGGDGRLRARLELLLEGYFKAEGFLTREPQSHGNSPDEAIGSKIGRYKLLEKIGEGGFGAVYVAEQSEPVKRRVALKIIKLGMDTRQVVARFEAERQALALMDHSNIAKVHDGGATETGRPYFVMELVRGVPITRYCQENELAIDERLKLFALVCQAVQHAHQKGIIHRDLKPSNILVTVNDGVAVPKVIDFGVAKATQQELTEKTIFTQFHHFIGTPAYMSPEQAELTSVDIDTRSDIYSLGVLLYELLTGKPPFDGKELLASGLDEMRRTIREQEPVRPSTRLARERTSSHSALRAPHSAIDPDLDWIVMKCLEKDRDRRYETANGLAADLDRHLSNEPVVARPPSATYRFQKFVRRNKVQFAAAAFALFVLFAATAVSMWQAIRATRAEKEAKRQGQIAGEQSENAEVVKAFLLENLLGVRAGLDTAPEPDALNYEASEALVRKVARQLEGKFSNQPLIEAEIRFSLGKAFGAVRDPRNAVEQHEKALQIWKNALGPSHSNTLVAVANLAYSKNEFGQRKEAENLLTNSFVFARNVSGELVPGGDAVIGTYGLWLLYNGRPAEALPYLEEVIARGIKLEGPKHVWIKTWKSQLVRATELAGRLDDAEELRRELFRECEQDHGADHFITVQQQFALARLLIQRTNRVEEAFPMIERVVSFNRQTLGRNHSLTMDSEFWLGQAYEQRGEIADAVQLYRDVHPRFAKFLPNRSAIFCETEMGRFFLRHKLYNDAKAVFGPLASALETHGRTAAEFEMLVQATAVTKGWRAAAEVCRKKIDDFAAVSSVWRTKATALLYAGDYAGYETTVAKALESSSTLKTWAEEQNILNVAVLGTNALSSEQKRECEALIHFGGQALETATINQQNAIHRVLGAMLLRLGQLTNSLEHLEQANYPEGINRARTLALKAICLHRLGRIDEARAALDGAEAMMRSPLLDQLSESEGFLSPDQRTYLIHRREARALLGLK